MSRLAGGAAFRVALLLATALAVLASHAMAADLPVPSQAEWAGAKKTVTLGNGVTIAYVETGDSEGPPLLLLHGMSDDNVLFQHSTELMAKMQEEKVPFEAMVYPGKGHSINGANTSVHVWTTILNFLERRGIGKGVR